MPNRPHSLGDSTTAPAKLRTPSGAVPEGMKSAVAKFAEDQASSDATASEAVDDQAQGLVDRPTGESKSAYKKYKNWSEAQWAWEFLRRNPNFLKASRDIRLNNSDGQTRAKVAKEFGLAEFKPAHDGFKTKNPPVFLVAAPPVVARLQANDPADLTPLEVGELVARIDLRIAMSDKHALKLQLDAIKTLVEAALVRFASASGKRKPIGRRNRTDGDTSNLDLLRVLDLLAARGKGHDFNDQRLMEILFPGKLKPKASGNDWRKFLSRVKDRANDMADHGYVKLVRAHSGKK